MTSTKLRIGQSDLASPSTSGNVLTSNGTAWISSPSASGDKYAMEARLTLETGVAISTTDQTAKTTLYLTKYRGDQIAVYNGTSAWSTIALTADLSITLASLTASLPYDVYVYSNAGTLTLELTAWTNTTTRATALTTQNGIYVKTGATTRRYIGTICITTTTGQCADSLLFRGVWNYYNRADRKLFKDVDTSHSYATPTNRYYNNDTTQFVNFVCGVEEDVINASIAGQWGDITAGAEAGYGAIGLDGTTTTYLPYCVLSINGRSASPVFISGFGVGSHKLTILEQAVGTVTFGNYTLLAIMRM